MPGVAKIGDLVSCVCCCHSDPTCVQTVGTIITGSGTVTVNGAPMALVGDLAVCSCGHITTIVGSSGTVIGENRGAARIGDAVSGCPVGTIISGSGNVEAN